jgi:hypothetical protein
MSKDKVTRLPVIGRSRDLALELVHYDPQHPCSHRRVSYRLREGEAEVECGGCGTRLDPLFVLKQLAIEDSLWKQRQRAAVKTAEELAERRRTKCQHCGRMTRIHGL